MATTAVDRCFIDTNVLVHANLANSPVKPFAEQKLLSLESAGVEIWISRQVLREYLAAMTRPRQYTGTIPLTSLIADIGRFEATYRIADDTARVTSQLCQLLAATPARGRTIHDVNIVATMLAHGIPRLLNHNAVDFARFVPTIAVEPLMP